MLFITKYVINFVHTSSLFPTVHSLFSIIFACTPVLSRLFANSQLFATFFAHTYMRICFFMFFYTAYKCVNIFVNIANKYILITYNY
nr:MAG TPA: hypothetical protein [Caudoviricetes sp.]